MKRFRLAMIGCGGVSQMHFEAYAAHSERVQIVAACDPSPEALEKRQLRYGFAQAFPTIERLLGESDFDVAVVCTPTPVREEVIRVLGGAGKAIYCEKPLADTFEEARRIVEFCRQQGAPLAVDQNFRCFYPFDLAQKLLADGRIGRPIQVVHRDLMFRQDRGWRINRPRHALSVMGVHWLDGFRTMLRDEAESVLCRTASSPTVECAGETDAAMQIWFERGVLVSYVQSFSSAVSSAETLVIGEHGTLRLGYSQVELFDRAHRGEAQERWHNPYDRPGGKPESCFAGLESLLSAIEQGDEPPNCGADNLKTIALLDAAYRSAEEGRLVALKGGLPG